MHNRFVSWEYRGWKMKLTTGLHNMLKSKMSRFIRLNTLYAGISWTDGEYFFGMVHNVERATKSLTSLRILKGNSKLRSRF
jgi:hypothetical protein